jgi:hypothetical protein
MRVPHPKLLPLIEKAAGLRAEGRTWEAVGAEVRRAPETCRRWPREYPDAWKGAFRPAVRRAVEDGGAEAVVVLRALLRSPSERTRLKAAELLLVAAAREAARDPAADPAAGVPGLPADLGYVSPEEYAEAEASCREQAAMLGPPLPAHRPVPAERVAESIRHSRMMGGMSPEEQLDWIEGMTAVATHCLRKDIAAKNGAPPPDRDGALFDSRFGDG